MVAPSYAIFTPLQWLLSLSVAGTFIGHGLNALAGGEPKMSASHMHTRTRPPHRIHSRTSSSLSLITRTALHALCRFTYLAVAGIGRAVGVPLVRLIGAFDVAIGVAALTWQWEGVLVCAALWGLATALMRPLAGESPLAVLECTGNFLPAVALLYLNTADEKTTYWWGMAALVSAMLGVSATLLLRQSGMLADAPARRTPAKQQRS